MWKLAATIIITTNTLNNNPQKTSALNIKAQKIIKSVSQIAVDKSPALEPSPPNYRPELPSTPLPAITPSPLPVVINTPEPSIIPLPKTPDKPTSPDKPKKPSGPINTPTLPNPPIRPIPLEI